MKKHIRAFKDYEEYKNADLAFPSVAYIEETPPEIGKRGVLYEKYEPPTIIARGTVTIPELPDGVTKEQVESMIAGQGFFIPIHLEYREAGGSGNILDEAFIPELSRQFTSFKVNGEETLKREPIVELGTVNPIAVEISEAAQGPLFTEESLILGASKLNVKFSKTPYILGLHLYLEALGGSINLGVPLEVWVTEEPFNSFLEIISDTEFNLDVKALVDLLSAELPGLDYTTVKSTLWGADEGSTIEDINSFSPTVNGYLGGSLTTGNTKMWWNSGEYEVIMKFDRNSKPCLDYLFYGSGLCSWKEIEFRGTFNNDPELPYYTWIGPKTSGTSFTTDSGSFPLDSLEKVILPESLKTINYRTFSGSTNLSVIGFPQNIAEIGSSAFSNCTSLTSITIPESVTNIGDNAFFNCTSLTAVQISNIEAWCKIEFENSYSNPLSYAHNLYLNGELVTNPVIPESVINIRDHVFYGCTSLAYINIPESVTSIGKSAFSGCTSLAYINIPESVTNIAIGAFQGFSGELIVNCNIPSASSYDKGVFYGGIFTRVTIGESVTSIGDYAFYNCDSFASITIPESVTSIGDHAFESCNSLASINIPENSKLTSIGESAFYNCNSLASITIPESVTSIRNSTFYQCDSLTSINIPESVTSIGRYAFYRCNSLASITIPESVTSIGDSTFYQCDSLTSINIPESVTSIGENAFYSCNSLASINIPENSKLTSIEDGAFAYCSSLTSITIPECVTSIGNLAFRDCSSLTSITVVEGNGVYDSRDNCNAIIKTSTNTLIYGCSSTIIPESVTSIGYYSFESCSSLTSINIPESVTSIVSHAFENCISLTSINIPENSKLTGIGSYAFRNCNSLTTITLPESVKSIGESAFYGCSSLISITSKAITPPSAYVFNNVNKSIPVYVPASSIDAYKAAKYWKDFTNFQAIS